MLNGGQIIVAILKLDGRDKFPSIIRMKTCTFFAQVQLPPRQPVLESIMIDSAFALAVAPPAPWINIRRHTWLQQQAAGTSLRRCFMILAAIGV
jgi:hypothetical protein